MLGSAHCPICLGRQLHADGVLNQSSVAGPSLLTVQIDQPKAGTRESFWHTPLQIANL